MMTFSFTHTDEEDLVVCDHCGATMSFEAATKDPVDEAQALITFMGEHSKPHDAT